MKMDDIGERKWQDKWKECDRECERVGGNEKSGRFESG